MNKKLKLYTKEETEKIFEVFSIKNASEKRKAVKNLSKKLNRPISNLSQKYQYMKNKTTAKKKTTLNPTAVSSKSKMKVTKVNPLVIPSVGKITIGEAIIEIPGNSCKINDISLEW